jgi:hypothetical protein
MRCSARSQPVAGYPAGSLRRPLRHSATAKQQCPIYFGRGAPLLLYVRRAPDSFAACVAIASMIGGDRQS